MKQNFLALSAGAIAGIVVAAVVAVLLIALVAWYISCGNRFVRLINRIDEAWATIDVSLKKRHDLIPNLVNTVKGYAQHESGTLEAVVSARNMALSARGDEKIAAENVLSGTLKSLFALQEAYPALKADRGFLDLQGQLRSVEDELASARRYYNGAVKELNTQTEVFPSSIVARRRHIEKRKYFELDSSEERATPEVKF